MQLLSDCNKICTKKVTNSPSDCRPAALTPTIMKRFGNLVLHHIKALHNVLSHLGQQQSSARMVFLDYSLAWGSISPTCS